MCKGSPYENEIKHRISGSRFIKKEVKRIEISEPQDKIGCFNMKQADNWGLNGSSESLDPRPFCHRYGHKEDNCYAKRDLVAGGKQNPRPFIRPPDNVMVERFKRYKERLQLKAQRKCLDKGRKMQQVENDEEEKNSEVQEKEEPEALILPFENVQSDEVGSLTMIAREEMGGYEQDLSMASIDIFLGSKADEKTYDVVVEKDGQQFVVCSCLDSGADTSAAARGRFEGYCSRLRELREPIRVRVANGVKHWVTHSGVMRMNIRLGERKEYDFGEVEVLLVNEVEGWTNLLLGDDLLGKHGLSPLQVLRKRAKECTSTEMKVANEVMMDWFVKKVLRRKKKGIKVKEVSVKGVGIVGGKKTPIIFKVYEDEILKDEYGIGENLEVSIEEDNLRLKKIINEKLVDIMKENIVSAKGLNYLREILMNNAQVFGDDKSPTQISKNVLQWIDDTILLGATLKEFCLVTKKFLKQLTQKRLWLNITNCDFFLKDAVLCGHLLTEEGHRLDKKCVVDLLGRRKPKYVHELPQLIFIRNWIAGILPYFARLRFILTEKYSIVGKIKALERRKEIIVWTEERNLAYRERVEKLEESFTATLGYFDAKLGVILFVDASKKHWVYFICQAEEEIDVKQILATQFKVIAMSSGTFVGSTLDWYISSKELFPVIAASRKYDYYLKGNSARKILFTDHRNLVYILNPSLCRKKVYSERLSHWSVVFQDLQLEVHHNDGDCNVATDALSRWLNPESNRDEEELLTTYSLEMSMEEVTGIDDFWRKMDEMHLIWRSPNCAESWPKMNEGYLLGLQRRDLGERIDELQKREGKLIVTASIIPSLLMHTHLPFNHGAAVLEKKVIVKEYTPLDDEVASLLMEGWKRFRRQCVHC
eukprot:augustus_masked-scaffold_26-processed-gene-4.23-mRNA-1 protein AED:1.00 eAED:1.00 QI:0/0/0/0/1/1/2/0/876